MTTLQMYLLVKLDDINSLFALLFIISVIWVLIHVVRWVHWGLEEKYNTPTTAPKMCARGVVVAILIAIVATPVPSTRQMAAIMIVPRIVNNEKVQTVGNELYTLALDWLKELRPEKKNK